MKERKFAVCKTCGNFVMLIEEGAGAMVCCGEPMELLHSNTTDASKEKHVPVAHREGNKLVVAVGEVAHPMQQAHFIKWIAAEQEGRTQIVRLSSSDEPKAEFIIEDGSVDVYEYCNLHGLWKAEF